jgi:hypothetical protein
VTTLFLLSPARTGGTRAQQLARSRSSELGGALRRGDAAIGDVFAWLSALYFRGKLAYARRFAPAHAFVMAPGLGLPHEGARISAADLRAMATVEVESDAFVRPLRHAAAALDFANPDARVVLLGSIATGKYTQPLLEIFGDRLLFPAEFVGRGDMSRGGLLLRAARAGDELAYTPVAGAVRRGTRPPKLPKLGTRA